MGVSAKVICDSSFGNTRLITLEVELHRFILSEMNTHRSLSRNYQSSRAVPVKQMIEQVRKDPAMPVHWGKNQPGMVAERELSDDLASAVSRIWQESAMDAARNAEIMDKYGAAKQLVNRVLEPFMWTKGVVTGTYDAWQAFLKLRAHKDAQPEIQALAFKIRDTIEDSRTNWLKEGEWHLPYVKYIKDCLGDMMYLNGNLPDFNHKTQIIPTFGNVKDAIKVSTSCTAQVSYRKLDDSLDKAMKIYDMLNLPKDGVYPDDPPHFSPTEHIAIAKDKPSKDLSGNFNSYDFIQYRKLLENGIESRYLK